jgi:hypothetical protein
MRKRNSGELRGSTPTEAAGSSHAGTALWGDHLHDRNNQTMSDFLVKYTGGAFDPVDHVQTAPIYCTPQEVPLIETWGICLQNQDRKTHPAAKWVQCKDQPYGRSVELAEISDFSILDPLAAELAKL